MVEVPSGNPDPPESEDDFRGPVGQTYMGLRLGMALLIILLFGSILIQTFTAHCAQTSISAYYHTAAHAVFIAVLCALGFCLIVIRGSTTLENVALDISGFLAFLVAFVPTGRDIACGKQATDVLVTKSEIGVSIANNVPMILIVGIVATLLGMLLSRWAPSGHEFDGPAQKTVWFTLVGLVVGLFLVYRRPDLVRDHGHLVFASTMFGGIILVLFANARDAGAKGKMLPESAQTLRSQAYARRYYLVITIMTGLSAICCALWLVHLKDWHVLGLESFRWAITCLETVAIAGFAVFWLLQTWELRDAPDREARVLAGVPKSTLLGTLQLRLLS